MHVKNIREKLKQERAVKPVSGDIYETGFLVLDTLLGGGLSCGVTVIISQDTTIVHSLIQGAVCRIVSEMPMSKVLTDSPVFVKRPCADTFLHRFEFLPASLSGMLRYLQTAAENEPDYLFAFLHSSGVDDTDIKEVARLKAYVQRVVGLYRQQRSKKSSMLLIAVDEQTTPFPLFFCEMADTVIKIQPCGRDEHRVLVMKNGNNSAYIPVSVKYPGFWNASFGARDALAALSLLQQAGHIAATGTGFAAEWLREGNEFSVDEWLENYNGIKKSIAPLVKNALTQRRMAGYKEPQFV